ncbi:MAG: class I SAM-dependent methyltransferase [Cyanobacteria bacterium P01_H01_bin.15]
MTQTTKFWNKIAKKYSKQPIADEASYQKKLAVTRDYFLPTMEVLEFGCGTGSTAILHAPYVKHIRAVDFSEQMIAIANEKAQAEGLDNVTFEQSSIEKLPESSETYDVVLGLSILHLLPDKESAIAKVYRLLKPGGYFITSTTCLEDFLRIFKIIGPIGRFLGFFPLVKVFGVQELEKSMTDANFIIDYQWQPAKDKAVFLVAKKPR